MAAVLGGVVGAGSVAQAAHASAPLPETLRLTATHADLRGSADRRYAVLTDRRGAVVGHLAGARMPLQAPFGQSGAPSAIESHTLSLAGGTLFAHGATDSSGGTFFILGGEGRFKKSRGSYRLDLRHATAALVLTIHDGEVS
jgi:hypothetical protein